MGNSFNVYLIHPSGTLEVAHSETEWTHLANAGYGRIGRAKWRQLKREQKAKAKQLSHDLMYEQAKRLMG